MPVRLAGVGTVGGVAIEKRSCGPGELNAFVASGPSPTDDEVSITTDGRRLHSAEAVIAFVAKLKGEDFVEEVVRERTVSNPEFPALVEAARVRHGGPRRSWLALTVGRADHLGVAGHTRRTWGDHRRSPFGPLVTLSIGAR